MSEREDGYRLNESGIKLMAPFMNQQTIFLLHLLCRIDGKGLIQLNPSIKKKLLKQAGCKSANPANVATQYLAAYSKANLITSNGGGEYRVNPQVASQFKNYTASMLKDSKDYMEFRAHKRGGPSVNNVLGGAE